jgi:dTDP-4-amino-4,6-dideoxygalactose transaminase
MPVQPPVLSVPLFDIATPLAPLRSALRSAVDEVIDGGRFILGPQVRGFEQEFAAYLGTREVIGVGNGTDALTIGLRAMGVGPGDDVVVPSFGFFASAEAVVPTGARPVFCDVDPDTFCATAETVRAALTPATRAVIAVHMFGNLAPVGDIEALGVPVLEDAAQAAGATRDSSRAGALGTASTFSFFPSKNLGCFGDGGAIATADAGIAERARTLRFHGSHDKRTFEAVGYNSRLDELQAAVLRVQLPHLDDWSAARYRVGVGYEESGLAESVALPRFAPSARPAWHVYAVRHPRADELVAALAEHGVEARRYYPTPIHRQPAMREWGDGVSLPATDEVARTHLALPMGATLAPSAVGQVAAAVRAALTG